MKNCPTPWPWPIWRRELWSALLELKNVQRGRISELATRFGLEFRAGKTPWELACDIALPCATQNELDAEAAQVLTSLC